MNTYIFCKASQNSIRVIHLDEDDRGVKSVANILEMAHDLTKESLKNTVRCLYEMVFIGHQPGDQIDGYVVRIDECEYDASLEGKARKQSSKEINVITEQLWG